MSKPEQPSLVGVAMNVTQPALSGRWSSRCIFTIYRDKPSLTHSVIAIPFAQWLTKVILFLLILTVRGASGEGSSKGWNDWMLQGKAFAAAGHYSDAAQSYRKALALANLAKIKPASLVELYNDLALTYSFLHRFTQAEQQYRQALAIVEASEGPGSPNYAILFGSIALLPGQTTLTEEAITTLRTALKSTKAITSASDVGIIRRSLAALLLQQKRYSEAESVLHDGLDDPAKRQSANQSALAGCLNDLAVRRFNQGRYGESVRLLETARELQSSYLIMILNNLAVSYTKMGRLQDAEVTYRRAISVAGKTLGEEHPDYGELLASYAIVLHKMRRKQESKSVFLRSQEIVRRSNRRNGTDATVAVALLDEDRPSRE